MAKPYSKVNAAVSTIAGGNTWQRGTDTSIVLTDATDFPSGGGYILIGDRASFAIMEYTGKTSNTLTGLTAATLGRVVTSGDETKTWPAATDVQRAHVAEDDQTDNLVDAELRALAGLTSAAGKVPYFTGSGAADLLDFLDEDPLTSDSATGIPSQQSVKAYVAGYLDIPNIAGGRLTLETGVPVSTADQTAKTTLYFTPFRGDRISLYTGTIWRIYRFAELSLDISAYTADKNYDIFLYDNAGTLTLEGLVWTNDTTRATALAVQNGVYVKDGATTRRYLGTIRITATEGQCEDSKFNRFVFNANNRVRRLGLTGNTTTSWTYATAAWRESNNGTTQTRCKVVFGLIDDALVTMGTYFRMNATDAGIILYEAVGIDSVDGSVQKCPAKMIQAVIVSVQGASNYQITAVGYHYFTTIEYGNATGTNTFYGSASYITGSCELSLML